jgi:hypothetical protein
MTLILASIFLASTLGGGDPAGPPAGANASKSVNLVIADQKTPTPRTTDTLLTARKQHLHTIEQLVRLRIQEDKNFAERAEKLYAALDHSDNDSALLRAKTGAEFLDALVAASRQAPISSLVIYGHSSPASLYMMEDRGFYRSVAEVAEKTPLAPSSDTDTGEKEQMLRTLGARDLHDLDALVRSGDIRFAPGAVVIFTGCAAAGEHTIDRQGIAASIAEIAHATVIASQGVTDQSIAGRHGYLTRNEYSRGSWVIFTEGAEPRRLAPRALDPLKAITTHVWAVAPTPTREVRFDPHFFPAYLCAAAEEGDGKDGAACGLGVSLPKLSVIAGVAGNAS